MKLPAVLSLGLKWSSGRVELMGHSLLLRSLPIPWPPLALMAIVLSPCSKRDWDGFYIIPWGQSHAKEIHQCF